MSSGIYKRTEEHKKNTGKASKRMWRNPIIRKKLIETHRKGYNLSEETKLKMSFAKSGKNNPAWKNGHHNYWSKVARRVWGNFWGQQVYRGYLIHHIDGDVTNNDISNLKLETYSSHWKKHNQKKSERR